MNSKSLDKKNTIETLKKIVASKGIAEPRVTADSGQERRWYPPFIVAE
ncbi:hypothetical protein LZC95_27905 [Pendulispora brunnea]|uniref:Uncharacterized protein n=1 Tax=Pendulispora brunnea TaxID=2905690 RepID=A0ABZ2JWZ7_9BACT